MIILTFSSIFILNQSVTTQIDFPYCICWLRELMSIIGSQNIIPFRINRSIINQGAARAHRKIRQMKNIQFQAAISSGMVSDEWYLITGIWQLASDILCLMTGIWWLASDIWWLVSNDWLLMTGFWWLVSQFLMAGF